MSVPTIFDASAKKKFLKQAPKVDSSFGVFLVNPSSSKVSSSVLRKSGGVIENTSVSLV